MSTCVDTTVRNVHGSSLDVWDGEILRTSRTIAAPDAGSRLHRDIEFRDSRLLLQVSIALHSVFYNNSIKEEEPF